MGARKRRRRPPSEPREAHIASLDRRGVGITSFDGRTVEVADALAGERVRYSEVDRYRGVGRGKLLEVVHPADSRVGPPCRHYGVCGGCSLQHMDPAAQVDFKQGLLLADLREIGGLEPQRVLDPVVGGDLGYRRRARLGIKDVPKKGKVLVGFRERDKRFVADLQACLVLTPPAGELIEPLSELIGELSLRARIPQVELTVSDEATALVFRVLDPPTPDDRDKLVAFGRAHQVRVFLQSGGPGTVVALDGPQRLRYRIDTFDVELEFLPLDFLQINAEVNRKMIDLAVDLLEVGPESNVLDLFCGLGNFSLPLARRAKSVMGVEGDEGLVERARANASRNALSNLRFEVADLYAGLDAAGAFESTYDAVLLDPPRSGAEAVVAKMSKLGARRIVYVACSPETLARDAGELVRRHGYTLKAAGVLDMFPHTSHVESIALLERT
ncbi:MAG: 23S rRNA (uracil(1939)-C(5))-methyltransferase RlmD [Nannocystaceae bacterium]